MAQKRFAAALNEYFRSLTRMNSGNLRFLYVRNHRHILAANQEHQLLPWLNELAYFDGGLTNVRWHGSRYARPLQTQQRFTQLRASNGDGRPCNRGIFPGIASRTRGEGPMQGCLCLIKQSLSSISILLVGFPVYADENLPCIHTLLLVREHCLHPSSDLRRDRDDGDAYGGIRCGNALMT